MKTISKERLEEIAAAAEKLVRCKGRYHSEQNYRALAALFGVTTPDLPPLESDVMRERAEPVAESDHVRREVHVGGNTWVQCSAQAYDRAKAEGKITRELFERPGQPVAVPDVEFDEWAKNVGLISESHGVRSVNSVTDIARKAWNACRAAMLAAPGKPSSLREGINALRELGGIDAEKILAERDALNECEIPEGWKLVPTEPTQEMCDAVLGRACFTFNGDGAKQIYEAMLAAAPGKEG